MNPPASCSYGSTITEISILHAELSAQSSSNPFLFFFQILSSFLSFRPDQRADRPLSSSPPSAAPEKPRPPPSPMRKALNKNDFRDDGWMMVEDEFLQTAKLFTRHLHLAEYERLRKELRASKGKEVVRPVVASAKPNIEYQLKTKARNQRKKVASEQSKAAKEEDVSNDLDAPGRPAPSKKLQASYPEVKQRCQGAAQSQALTHLVSSKLDAGGPIPSTSAPKVSKYERSIADVFGMKRISNPQPSEKSVADTFKQEPASPKPLPRPRYTSISDWDEPQNNNSPSGTFTKTRPLTKPAFKPPAQRRSRYTSIMDMEDDDLPPREPPPVTSTTSAKLHSLSTSNDSSRPFLRDELSSKPKQEPSTSISKAPHRSALSFLDEVTTKAPHLKEAGKLKLERNGTGNRVDEKKKRKSLRLDEIPTFLV